MALTKIDDRGLKTPVDLLDNEKIRFGTGNDLEIFHNGSHSFIKDTGTGALVLNSSVLWLNDETDTETYLKATKNGAVEIRHDNIKKFETTTTGTEVISTTDALLKVNNTGDGTATLMLHNTGSTNFQLALTNAVLTIGTTTEASIKATANGAVELYHNNVKKFETSSDGGTLTGNWICTNDFKLDNSSNAGKDVVWNASNNRLRFEDSVEAAFGDGEDLKIYHDGSHSYIQNGGTGSLYIRSNNVIAFLDDSGDEMLAKFVDNGRCELYYDNSKKFETTGNGVTLTSPRLVIDGSVSSNVAQLSMTRTDRSWNINNETELRFYTQDADTETPNTKIVQFGTTGIQLPDNIKYQAGTGNDLQIYHSGSESYIDDNGTGRIHIRGNDGIHIQSYTGTEDCAAFLRNGSVELYYDNSKKFHTASYGAVITGKLFFADSSSSIEMGDASDLKLYHNGSHSYIWNTTGDLQIRGDSIYICSTGGEGYLEGTANGATKLFYDNSKRLETSGNGAIVYGPEGSDATLYIYADEGDDNHDKWKLTASAADSNFYLSNYASGSWESSIVCHDSGGVELYHDNTKKLSTTANGICFNSDTAAANALDDYEEGTFTPTLSVSGNSNANVTLNDGGTYTKVGRHVYARAYITLTSKGSGASASTPVMLGGLPFTAIGGHSAGFVHYWHNTPTDYVSMTGTVQSSTTNMLIRMATAADDQSNNMRFDGIQDGTSFIYSVSYEV